MSKKTFIACLEEENVAYEIQWDGEHIPHVIGLPNGTLIRKIGKYASPGDRYCFEQIEIVYIPLREVNYVDFHAEAGKADVAKG